MISKALYKITENMPTRLIYQDGRPYMERYLVFRLFFVHVWLHRFVRCDQDRGLHCHPFRSLAFVISGSYVEKRLVFECLQRGDVCKYRKLGGWKRFNFLSLNSKHQIIKVEPETWTLFIRARRLKAWGFYRYIVFDEGKGSERITSKMSNPFHKDYNVETDYSEWPSAKKSGREPLN